MKNISGLLPRCIFLFHLVSAADTYQSIRLYNPTIENIEIIAKEGIPLDHLTGKKGVFLNLITTKDQTIKLMSKGLQIDVIVSDLTKHYRSRNNSAVNRDFPLGSMQGNYTWDELNIRFNELQSTYPNLISNRTVIGQSTEGRDIWAFKVSDNPNDDENEPEVLFTGLTHSREPLSMMNLFYFVQQLVEQYGLDPELTYLTNNREIWFIPVINPDGYVYNESIEPNGGGMHRKNRLDTNCGNGTGRGVDLNRNYGFGWGANDIGSSPDPCSATYRGESSFSEPETQAVRDFILNHDFKNILHYHSYSNVYIHAYGDASLPAEPDLTTLREIGHEMARYNGYLSGTGYEVIGYTVNGDAVDWTYGEQNIIAYTPEVGTQAQGFWPSEDDVLQLCIDQLHANKVFSHVSGPDIIIHSYQISEEYLEIGQEAEIEILIQNRGLTNSGSEIEVSFLPLNNLISLDLESFTISEIDARDSDDISFSFTISDDAIPGNYSGIIVSLHSENSYSRTDTIKFFIGQPQTLFFDGFENELDNWVMDGDWGLSNESVGGSYALSDSPEGDYGENQETSAELVSNISFNYVSNPMVTFNAKWDIENNWDFVRFQAFIIDSGWVSLQGQFTEEGTGQPAQPLGHHGYDGSQEEWVDEVIYLNQLEGEVISGFRFIQTSDNFVEGDGFVFDNFSLMGFPTGTMGDFNLDTSLDIFDLLGLADLLLFGNTPSEEQLFFCDLDGSGNLNIVDILALTNLILGL